MRELTWNECDAVSGAMTWAEAYETAAKIGGMFGAAAGAGYATNPLSITQLFTTTGAQLLAAGAASGAVIGAAVAVAAVSGAYLGTALYDSIDVYLLDGIQFIMTSGAC